MASGTPVITSHNAGVANELVLHNKNGYVLPLKEEIWAKYSLRLLNNNKLYQNFAKHSIIHVKNYNFNFAAKGIIKAIEYAIQK